MTAGIKTGVASSYYIEFQGIEECQIKGTSGIKYEGKVAGNSKPTGSGKQGRQEWNTYSGGYQTNPSIQLNVYASGDSSSASYKLFEWFKKCLPPSYPGGQGQWSQNRKTGSVTLYDSTGSGGTELVRYNITNGWIKKYSLEGSDVAGGDLIVETYDIVAEKIEMAESAKGGPIKAG
jgi:phage tail-like protein